MIASERTRRAPFFPSAFFLEEIGRAAMDFGLGAYLEKFEAHFGERWTRAILIIVGLAIVSTAGAAVVSLVIKPLWSLLKQAIPSEWTLSSVGGAFFLALQIGAGIAFGSIMLDAYRKRLATEEIEDLVPKTRSAFEEAKEFHQ